MIVCAVPLSPRARRAALIRVVTAEIRHDPACPDPRDQIIAAYHAVAVAQQVDDQIEYLRLNRDLLAAAAQLAAIDVEGMFAEIIPQVRLPAAASAIGKKKTRDS